MYDIAIIGAGWAGFNAALTAKAAGLNVCLIEASELGGTCLNRGCIPTKALLRSSKVYSLVTKSESFGVSVSCTPVVSMAKIHLRKENIVQQLRRGMEYMLKGVDLRYGLAKITGANTLAVGAQEIKARAMLIATGSEPVQLEGLAFDGEKILSSSDIINLPQIPDSLLIVGGGVIGCEFATLFSSLGAKVTVIEATGQLLPGEDEDIAKKLEVVFRKKGIQVITGVKAVPAQCQDFQKILVSVGRRPRTDIPGLEEIGLSLQNKAIGIDEFLRTSVASVYAAGDCTGKVMLAHYAAYQGRIAAENILHPQRPKSAPCQAVPNCIFTDPQISSVGLNEARARQQNIAVEIKRFDFRGLGMARILDEADGFLKIISHQKTGQILGASLIGPEVTELISVLTLAVQSRRSISELAELIFPHPTLSEAIGEALASVSK